MEFPASPGPWKFGYTDDLQTPIIVDANDDVVCVMHEGVTIKDGKLMAVAPELLDALRSIKKRMYEPRPFSIRACEAIIDDAIAKATGK